MSKSNISREDEIYNFFLLWEKETSGLFELEEEELCRLHFSAENPECEKFNYYPGQYYVNKNIWSNTHSIWRSMEKKLYSLFDISWEQKKAIFTFCDKGHHVGRCERVVDSDDEYADYDDGYLPRLIKYKHASRFPIGKSMACFMENHKFHFFDPVTEYYFVTETWFCSECSKCMPYCATTCMGALICENCDNHWRQHYDIWGNDHDDYR